MKRIQRYSIKRHGGVDLDDALVPYAWGQVVKYRDAKRCIDAQAADLQALAAKIGALEARVARLMGERQDHE